MLYRQRVTAMLNRLPDSAVLNRLRDSVVLNHLRDSAVLYHQRDTAVLNRQCDSAFPNRPVDFEDPHRILKHLVRVCLVCDLTLMLAWNAHEAGKIIETYKVYENKPADLIMEKQETESKLQVMNALSSIRSINRTDAATLLHTFGSLSNIAKASKESIGICPGIGSSKAARLKNVLKQPFRKSTVETSSKKNEITKFLKKKC